MPVHEPWTREGAVDIVQRHVGCNGPLLPVLHDIQERFGHVPVDAVPLVADALNLSRAEVHGVISFYHDFRGAPPGLHVLKLCAAEACQSMGGDALAAHAEARLATKLGTTTADGRITVEAVYCLGLCACAPAAMLDGEPYGRLDPIGLDALLTAITELTELTEMEP